MTTLIDTRNDLTHILPGLFEVYGEVRRNGGRIDTVRLERTRGNEYAPGGIFAAGRFSNHKAYRNMDGTTSFDDLLEWCREEGAALYLDTDFFRQRQLKTDYEATAATSRALDDEG